MSPMNVGLPPFTWTVIRQCDDRGGAYQAYSVSPCNKPLLPGEGATIRALGPCYYVSEHGEEEARRLADADGEASGLVMMSCYMSLIAQARAASGAQAVAEPAPSAPAPVQPTLEMFDAAVREAAQPRVLPATWAGVGESTAPASTELPEQRSSPLVRTMSYGGK